MKVTNDLLIWLFIFLLLAFIFGLYSAENHRIPNTLYQRTKGSAVPYLEHFGGSGDGVPSHRSSGFDVMGGASGRYGWGVSGDDYQRGMIREREDQLAKDIEKKDEERKDRCQKPENKNEPQCTRDDDFKIRSEMCRRCDILDNPDIDKYVLKSSVPPCPNLNNYIKKSEIPSCKNADIDLNDYMKKSEIPAIPKCPECPKADCPKPADAKEAGKASSSTKNYNYQVVGTQDIEMLLQDKRIREYLDANYEKKNNVPKPTSNVNSAQSLFDMGNGSGTGSGTSYNKPTSTLWGEIKSFFGFGEFSGSEGGEESNDRVMMEEESSSARVVTPVSANFPGATTKGTVKEEETKMVYNKSGNGISGSPAIDAQNCNTKPSDMSGMYAGDSLYSTV